MEHSESANCVTIPRENPDLGFQSPPGSPSRDPDVTPPSDGDQTAGEEKLREELEKQLDLKEDEEDKASNVSNNEDDFKSGWSGGEDIKNEGEGKDENEKVGDEVANVNERSNGDRIHQYPLRLDAEDCAYYMKTGTCKFGSNCKFNHPVRKKKLARREKAKETEEEIERPGQTECKYYLTTGGCKYGKACKFNHSREKTPGFPTLELNFLGLPIRLGERECPFYMRNGSCKYGAQCRFNHPDPTAVGGSIPQGSASLQGSSQSGVASWSSSTTLNGAASYVPIIFPPSQGVPSQSSEWNGYPAPVYPPEGSMHPSPAYLISNPTTETNVYAQMLVDEFPERPGQPECSFFMKTGDCKFKSNCKFHHPKNRISKSLPCVLSDKGLPLRPDQNICAYYMRYGICKFGPACKFDHPENLASSTESGNDQPASFVNSPTREEAAKSTTESGNASDTAIPQPV